MQTKSDTLIHYAATFIIALAFMGMLGALAVGLMVVGIYWAFEIIFSVGWWASLLVMVAVAGLYLAALFGGCKLLNKGKA